MVMKYGVPNIDDVSCAFQNEEIEEARPVLLKHPYCSSYRQSFEFSLMPTTLPESSFREKLVE